MSLEDAVDLAAKQLASFGSAPAAISVSTSNLERVVRYHLASMMGDGYLVDFGDSHASRGFSPRTFEAALARRIVADDPSAPLALSACQARELNAAMYGSFGVYVDPWRIAPQLASLSTALAELSCQCTATSPSLPLGSYSATLFPQSGYASLRLPLLQSWNASGGAPCFGEDMCINTELPSRADFLPYSTLALQARPSSWIKSEVDFGTVVWSTWGARLLSEFGYGTIATTSNAWDTRRLAYLDNNPAGHNTVVVREAFQDDDETEINFSQFSHVAGALSTANVSRAEAEASVLPPECVLLDGSDVYGASRPDGWLSVMRRYVCMAGETHMIVDLLQPKSGRVPLVLSGGASGGPPFNEGGVAHQALHLDEYFYTQTSAVLEFDADGKPSELPFDTPTHPRASKCAHVNVHVVQNGLAVELRPQCGLGSRRGPDGFGLIGGFSAVGGSFVYDGLITTVDRWLTPHYYQKRRFRFVGNMATDSAGDVRAFVLASSPASNRSAMPAVRMSECSAALGCGAAATPLECSCVQMCVGTTLRWAAVVVGKLVAVHVVGTCDASAEVVNQTLAAGARVEALGPQTPAPTVSPTLTPTASPTAAPTADPPSTSSPAAPPEAASAAFPSADYSLILPGQHEVPTAPSALAALPTVEAVQNWEVASSGASFGGDFGSVLNQRLGVVLGYMYAQILDFDPGKVEMALRRRAISEGVPYEDFLLHFSEDTEIDPPKVEHASQTSLGGKPWVVGWTAQAGHAGFWLYQTPPWNGIAAWSGAAAGGAVYVYQFERFDEIDVCLTVGGSGGRLRVEYPSAVGVSSVAADGVVVDRLATSWSVMSLTFDGTAGLTRSGRLRWHPPADWQMASTHDGSGKTYGGTGPYFGQSALRDGGVAYVVRLHWEANDTSSSTATDPTLCGVRLRRWIAPQPNSSRVRIPGWDPANDLDGDGYVSDSEVANPVNPQCSARFRHEARAVPYGRMWSSRSSWCRVDPTNTVLSHWLGQLLNATWSMSGLGGAYNDDLLKLVGPAEYNITLGGQLAEWGEKANSTALVAPFTEAFAAMLERIKQVAQKWIAANISARNMFMAAATRAYLRTLSFLLREDYITSATGLTGYFGHLKAWDVGAATAHGIRSLVQCQLRHGRVAKLGKGNRSNWEADQESCLAQYYLLHHPGMTYFNVWGNGFNYGSQNTYLSNWWEAGVPMNYAYQPAMLLGADIGVPQPDAGAALRDNDEPIQYMVRTQSPLSDYTLLGDSNSSQLQHAEINDTGVLDIRPTRVFYIHRSEDSAVAGAPQEAVLARRFTRGLVLYRTDLFGHAADFLHSLSEPIALGGWYHRVSRTTGQLGAPTRSLQLRGYEGAVLVRAVPPAPPSPSPAPTAACPAEQCGGACPFTCQLLNPVSLECVGAESSKCPCPPTPIWCIA